MLWLSIRRGSKNMRACLIPLKTEPRDPSANLQRLKQCLAGVARYQPDLICLPECTLTGYLHKEDDLSRFAQTIPGPATEQMAQLARRCASYLCFGLVERTRAGIFNSAVLLNRTGRIILTHRKVEEKPPFVNGHAVDSVDTEMGRLAILICGDLFSRSAVQRLDRSVNWLIMLMARRFDRRSPDADRWISEERQAYMDAVKAASVNTLIVNALEMNDEGGSFGGAIIVSAKGELRAESPHGTDDTLIWESDAG
jgi:predicted amidohydrolase